jgi:hypothetical protein
VTLVDESRRLANDGHHIDGFITLPAEVLFDRTLSEEGVALYAVLVSTGLRLGLGFVLEDLISVCRACHRRQDGQAA